MARVIRPAGARVVPAAAVAAGREAEAILEAAREAAERERERLRGELEAEAREAARAELAAAHLALEQARAGVLAEAEGSITAIALAAAQKIVAEELALRPEHIRAIVRGAVERVRSGARARVRVHPSDAAHLALSDVAVIEDASIERGGCVVESELGDVDARLEVRLAAIERALRGGRR